MPATVSQLYLLFHVLNRTHRFLKIEFVASLWPPVAYIPFTLLACPLGAFRTDSSAKNDDKKEILRQHDKAIGGPPLEPFTGPSLWPSHIYRLDPGS